MSDEPPSLLPTVNLCKTLGLPIESPDIKQCSSKNIQMTPEKAKRKITTTPKWKFDVVDSTLDQSFLLLNQLLENLSSREPMTQPLKLFQSEIRHKISSYRSQDVLKKLYTPDTFVDYPFVLRLLIDSQLNCFYCKQKVMILYQNVREPLQWSLERIDNAMGHIKDNCVIACLSCNLRRRTMYHERYVFTKNMGVVKKLS